MANQTHNSFPLRGSKRRSFQSQLLTVLSVAALGTSILGHPVWSESASAQTEAAPAAPKKRRRREPPPLVIPTKETLAAQTSYDAGNYAQAVETAKSALNLNERYTPAMLIMAKSFFKLGKYEWVRTLWETMQQNKASPAEAAEVHQLLAFLEIEKDNLPGAIEELKNATESRPDNAIMWNNLGAMYLTAKNYPAATPALEKATQLQPNFAKAFMNLGSAYRGNKSYSAAQTAYERALQLFPNYADAVFNLGILFLDADRIEGFDEIAKQTRAISYLQKYQEMMSGRLSANDPSADYIVEAQEKIEKEQKRLERERKRKEREARRAAKRAAEQDTEASP